jgi:hypothetical protein
MRLYPNLPGRRSRTLAGDAAVLVAVLLFAWLGLEVNDRVDDLAALGRGVQDAGAAVQGGFTDAGDAVGDVPLVGDRLRDGLRDAGQASGGSVKDAGEEGERDAERLGLLLGWLTFVIPTALVMQRWLPDRVRQVQNLTAASRALGGQLDAERTRVVAMRAAFNLPFGSLLRHTDDPLGDLVAGRYEPLVAAAFEDAGLKLQ